MSIPIVKRFLGKIFLSPVKNGPQNGANSGKWGSRYYILCSRPRKGTSLGGTACFGIFCVKIRPRPLAVESCKNPKKLTRFWCAKSRMRRNNTPGRIVTNFCTGVSVHDVITSANFYDCRFWGLSVVGDQILGFSIDSRCRPYNTLALPCECVMYTVSIFVMNLCTKFELLCTSILKL